MPRPTHILAALIAVAALAAGGSAQSITGVVVQDGTNERLPGALLLLVDDEGETRTETVADDSGAFFIEAPAPGLYLIRGSLIGYAPIQSEALAVGPGENVVVEVRMAIEAVPLEPLVVRSRSSTLDANLAGFYDRMARGRRSGMGHFISREDVDRFGPLESTDLLRMAPGVRVVRGRQGYGAGLRMSGGCVPAIYVDGTQVNRYPHLNQSLDDIVAAFSIEGIEVYRGASASVGAYHDSQGCGLVLVWTRRGSAGDGPWSWKKFLGGFGLVAALFFLMR